MRQAFRMASAELVAPRCGLGLPAQGKKRVRACARKRENGELVARWPRRQCRALAGVGKEADRVALPNVHEGMDKNSREEETTVR